MTEEPTLWKTAVFHAKACLLRLRRAGRNLFDTRNKIHGRGGTREAWPILAESITPLWTAEDNSELRLLAGKIHNLRLALRRLDGVEVPAGGMFSFWKQVGRATRLRGYVAGRELREGCVVPAVGGGICQISNALYDCAARAGFEILERHAHTRVIPGSLAESGRDATVFWNYLDLRFAYAGPFRIEADLNADSLRVRLRGNPAPVRPANPPASPSPGARVQGMQIPESCWTCGVTTCHRHQAHPARGLPFGRKAFLVDEHWPEFDRYLQSRDREKDVLALPLDGRRWGKAAYAWRTEGYARVRTCWPLAMLRAGRLRHLAAQGAARQRSLLAFHARLAARYASFLDFDITEVAVMQSLLPFLWREGHLGGRAFDVLMTALPMRVLQQRLDGAAARHPGSPTLEDFRAPEALVRSEEEALRQARSIVTPHAGIAALFPGKAVLLDWELPREMPAPRRGRERPFTVAFPASTLGRKGAHALREAISGLDVRLLCAGPILEERDFWKGIRMERSEGRAWLEEADVVALPAYVEHKPRRLLQALASGIPVIATAACGLGDLPGVVTVPAGDSRALRSALLEKAASAAHSPTAMPAA